MVIPPGGRVWFRVHTSGLICIIDNKMFICLLLGADPGIAQMSGDGKFLGGNSHSKLVFGRCWGGEWLYVWPRGITHNEVGVY